MNGSVHPTGAVLFHLTEEEKAARSQKKKEANRLTRIERAILLLAENLPPDLKLKVESTLRG